MFPFSVGHLTLIIRFCYWHLDRWKDLGIHLTWRICSSWGLCTLEQLKCRGSTMKWRIQGEKNHRRKKTEWAGEEIFEREDWEEDSIRYSVDFFPPVQYSYLVQLCYKCQLFSYHRATYAPGIIHFVTIRSFLSCLHQTFIKVSLLVSFPSFHGGSSKRMEDGSAKSKKGRKVHRCVVAIMGYITPASLWNISDIQKDAKCITDAEALQILQGIRGQMVILSERSFDLGVAGVLKPR